MGSTTPVAPADHAGDRAPTGPRRALCRLDDQIRADALTRHARPLAGDGRSCDRVGPQLCRPADSDAAALARAGLVGRAPAGWLSLNGATASGRALRAPGAC